MAPRHLIIGGGTAGMNAIRTIREEETERSTITLVSAEKPYSRMVLPYYLDRSIAESHVFTATARVLADWGVTTQMGKRATALDTKANVCTLDDGTTVEYDDCVIATGSSAVRAPVPGADGPGVHSFWTLDQARGVLAQIQPGSHVVMVGAGFIAITILNSILSLGAKLTIVEVAPRILPRMIDDAGAGLVQAWLEQNGVAVRPGAKLTRIDDAKGRRRLKMAAGGDLVADVVIMATGIRTNPDRPAYRKLLWRGDRLTGAIILGPSSDIWTSNDVGMLKGLVQSGVSLGPWKAHLKKNPFDIKPAFIATKTTSSLLPETILGRPSKAPGESPVAV